MPKSPTTQGYDAAATFLQANPNFNRALATVYEAGNDSFVIRANGINLEVSSRHPIAGDLRWRFNKSGCGCSDTYFCRFSWQDPPYGCGGPSSRVKITLGGHK